MKLPRDVSDQEVIKALKKLGYYPVRQRGSHVILVGPTGKMMTVPPQEPKNWLTKGYYPRSWDHSEAVCSPS